MFPRESNSVSQIESTSLKWGMAAVGESTLPCTWALSEHCPVYLLGGLACRTEGTASPPSCGEWLILKDVCVRAVGVCRHDVYDAFHMYVCMIR